MTDETQGTPSYTMGYSEEFRQLLDRRSAERNAKYLLTHLEPGHRVLDFGCGPGTISVGLAKAVEPGELHGIDMEESQIGLARAAAEAGCTVTIVPGPSAPLAAAAVSGLTGGRFVYEGFLPRRGAARTERLAELAASPRAVVLLEAPQRCPRTAADLAEAFGPQRRVVAVRELTKLHEEIWRGTLAGLVDRAGEGVRGELVLVIEGAPPPPAVTDEDIAAALRAERAAAPEASTRDLTAAVAAALDIGRRRVYQVANTLDAPEG